MKPDKTTVTIGIPAFNEEENIGHLLDDLLRQNTNNFILEKIIVASDASTDRTNQIVKAKNNQLINLIENSNRQGVAIRQNQIIDMSVSDILILLNADILIKNPNFINNLVHKINDSYDLVSGPLLEIEPCTFFEKILAFGARYKRLVFSEYKGGYNFFTCHGSHRAFSKRFYKVLSFSESLAEDSYSYLSCVINGFKYGYAENAEAYIKLPNNLVDHVNQSSRFFTVGNTLSKSFSLELINQNTKWPTYLLMKNGFLMFLNEPVLAIFYLLTCFIVKIAVVIGWSGKSNTWSLVSSSKNLRRSI